MNFYEIKLNKQEFDALCALFEAFNEHCSLRVTDENRPVFQHLKELKLAEISFTDGNIANKSASLTDKGKNYFYFAKAQRHDKRFENTRYWITTGIALLALLASVLALLRA